MSLILKLILLSAVLQMIHSSFDVNIDHSDQRPRNLEQLFRFREHDYILKLVVNDQVYFAHKNILSSSSLFLRSAILQLKEKDEIKLNQLELAHNDSFSHVVEYMYTGKLVLNNQEIARIFDFMLIAKTLELTSLMEEISLLLKNSINRDNVVLIYENAFQFAQKMLKELCEHLIDQHAEYLVAQKSLIKLSSECLQEILGRDSFGIIETNILELVNEWHVYHNRTENVSNELINIIRFELFSNNELFNLTSHYSLIDERLTFQILKERLFHESTKMPTRLFQTTVATTISQTKTTTIRSNINYVNKLASGSEDKTIRIWNLDTGECIRTLKVRTYFYSLHFLDSNKLACGTIDNSIQIWNVDNSECIRTFTGHSRSIYSLQSLPNNQLASASADKTIKIWDIDTGECIRTLTGHSSNVYVLQLLGNNQLASGADDTTIKIWNVDSGECIRTLTGHLGGIWSLQTLSNHKLASGSADNSIKIWSVDSGECIRTLNGHKSVIRSLQLLPENKLASGSCDKSIKIWNVDSGECLRSFIAHNNCVYGLQLLSDNKLASASGDSSIKIWKTDTGQHVRTLLGHSGWVWPLQSLANTS